MKTKHTPGPWVAEDEHKPNYESYQIHNGKEIVCHGLASKNKNVVVSSANMLSFLVKLERAIRTEPFDDDLYKELTELIKSATE